MHSNIVFGTCNKNFLRLRDEKLLDPEVKFLVFYFPLTNYYVMLQKKVIVSKQLYESWKRSEEPVEIRRKSDLHQKLTRAVQKINEGTRRWSSIWIGLSLRVWTTLQM